MALKAGSQRKKMWGGEMFCLGVFAVVLTRFSRLNFGPYIKEIRAQIVGFMIVF